MLHRFHTSIYHWTLLDLWNKSYLCYNVGSNHTRKKKSTTTDKNSEHKFIKLQTSYWTHWVWSLAMHSLSGYASNKTIDRNDYPHMYKILAWYDKRNQQKWKSEMEILSLIPSFCRFCPIYLKCAICYYHITFTIKGSSLSRWIKSR